MSTIQGAILGIAIAAFAALGLVVLLQHHRIAEDQTRYEQLLQNNAVFQAENNSWKLVAGEQNRKILRLAAAQAERNAALEKTMAAAKINAGRAVALAAKIDALQTGADDCAGAARIKNLYLGSRK